MIMTFDDILAALFPEHEGHHVKCAEKTVAAPVWMIQCSCGQTVSVADSVAEIAFRAFKAGRRFAREFGDLDKHDHPPLGRKEKRDSVQSESHPFSEGSWAECKDGRRYFLPSERQAELGVPVVRLSPAPMSDAAFDHIFPEHASDGHGIIDWRWMYSYPSREWIQVRCKCGVNLLTSQSEIDEAEKAVSKQPSPVQLVSRGAEKWWNDEECKRLIGSAEETNPPRRLTATAKAKPAQRGPIIYCQGEEDGDI